MSTAFFRISNTHGANCGDPPTITNQSRNKYYGYFQNSFGEQWVFVYDYEKKIGQLRGGDIGWDTVAIVEEGRVDVMLGTAETVWLHACWQAATCAG